MFHDTTLALVHHHAFKCAGSTFMWILEKNYPGKVLYVEGADPGHRIYCNDVLPYLRPGAHMAVSSHLLAIPPLGRNIAHLHVGFLREPIDRLVSAYHFLRRTGDAPADTTFKTFCATHFQADNFQMRHCSVQHPEAQQGDWAINREIYAKLAGGEVFLGLTEQFDHSLLMLEALLKDKGIDFDGAYPAPVNVTRRRTDAGPLINRRVETLLSSKLRPEIELYTHVRDRFLKDFWERFQFSDLDAFRERCQALRSARATRHIHVPTWDHWLYVPAATSSG